MSTYSVHVTIENKAEISDPEGETILNDLVLKRTEVVSSVRTAKMLKFVVDAESSAEAASTVRGLCEDLRLYNPIVSSVSVEVADA